MTKLCVSIRDCQLPRDIADTLAVLLRAGYSKADLLYSVDNLHLAELGLSLGLLRNVLHTGLVQVSDGTGNVLRPQTAILTALAQDTKKTIFRLLVDLEA